MDAVGRYKESVPRLLSLAVLVLSAHPGRGAEAVVGEPIAGPTWTNLNHAFTNNDVGSEYASGVTNTVQLLAEQIAALNGTTVSTIMSEWTYNISGEVDAGWQLSPQADGSVLSSTAAPFGNDLWRQSTPSLDMQIQSMGIANARLELNATAGYQPFGIAEVASASWDPSAYDAIIVRSDDPLLSAPNYRFPSPEELLEVGFVGSEGGALGSNFSTPSRYYLALSPDDFAEWTEFGEEHPGLVGLEDANGNGRSNFLDYASGQDPEADGLLPIVELDGTTLTLRRRINGIDVLATAQFSDTLSGWLPLEEGVHYTVTSESVDGDMRTLVLELLPGQPARRFFRQSFGP